jgi:hypothetical protein
MLGFVIHMGIKVDQEPHSQSTVGTAAPAVQLIAPARKGVKTHLRHCIIVIVC